MKSWEITGVPAIEGRPPALRLLDTATRELRDVAGTGRMYVCGITPYDATHMGHAFTYVSFDLVNRAWRDAGLDVHYVQNVTDIDDPLLERAVALGADWREIADRETALFREDMSALNVVPPMAYIGAVESIPQVAGYVQQLLDRGIAYYVDDDIYFDVESDPLFGQVSGYDADTMIELFAERGGDPTRPGKRHPLDCLVWLRARPDEPAWDTILGHGRPGWHIECTAIALDHLGMGFDVQGGGSDLIFPHHEMCAAEAQVLTEQSPFATHYVHVGMVGLDGHKMSKSRGNLVFVSRLRENGVDPAAIRLSLLAHHYRSEWEWSDRELADAQARLRTWRDGVQRATGRDAQDVIAGIRAAIADDLNAPEALRLVDAWCAATGDDATAPSLVRNAVDALLGVRL